MSELTDFLNPEVVANFRRMPASNNEVMYPAILEYVLDLPFESISAIDIGCGAGHLTTQLAKQQRVGRVDGIDCSPYWKPDWAERLAELSEEEKSKIKFTHGDARVKLPSGIYSVAIANMLFLGMDYPSPIGAVFGQVHRRLHKRGYFIFSDLHPLTKVNGFSGTEEQRLPDDFDYFVDGSTFSSKVRAETGEPINFTDAHWSPSFFAKTSANFGMPIVDIIEPKPLHSSGVKPNELRPEYIIYVGRKL